MMRLCFAVPVMLMALTGCDAFNAVGDGVKADAAKTEAATKLNPAQQAYTDANAKMHHGMSDAIDPDADIAFMQGMIPHHQGAVDMARVVLEHGKDPETRKLAEAVIASQTAEIAAMEAWLEKRGLRVAEHEPEHSRPDEQSGMEH